MRFRWTRIIQDKARRFQLRRHGVRMEPGVRGKPIRIINHGEIHVGERTFMASYPQGEPFITSLNSWLPGSVISIGHHCILNGTVIHARNRVTIGPWCMFGPGVVILDNNSHAIARDPMARRTGSIEDAPVELGSNVWVGMRSLVMKGVKIGDNTIVASGSVVTRDLPADVIAGGNPCRVIRDLED